jgi:hypothetical protein
MPASVLEAPTTPRALPTPPAWALAETATPLGLLELAWTAAPVPVVLLLKALTELPLGVAFSNWPAKPKPVVAVLRA